MYFILKNKTDDLKSKTNSRFRPFSNKIEKKSQSNFNFASTKFQNQKQKTKTSHCYLHQFTNECKY